MKHISTKKPKPIIVWPAGTTWEQKHSMSMKYMSIREHTWKDQEQNQPSSHITGKKTLCHHPDLRQGPHQKNTKTYMKMFSAKYMADNIFTISTIQRYRRYNDNLNAKTMQVS